MRALWSLPKAAPALLRHLAAYAELVALDFAKAQREIAAELIAVAVLSVFLLLALLFACIGIIAYNWDTPYRITSIEWMCGSFIVIAVIAGVIRARLSRARSPFMAELHREWQEDRLLLERILADEE